MLPSHSVPNDAPPTQALALSAPPSLLLGGDESGPPTTIATDNNVISLTASQKIAVPVGADEVTVVVGGGGNTSSAVEKKERLLWVSVWCGSVGFLIVCVFVSSILWGNDSPSKGPISETALRNYVTEWCKGGTEMAAVVASDGPIEDLDTSTVADFSDMFSVAATPSIALCGNPDVSSWSTASATTMKMMFRGQSSFNQNIGAWDVSQVTDIMSMFHEAFAFNQNIGAWNMSKVTDIQSMFYRAHAFNQNIGAWDVSQVTDMFSMFWQATSFNNGGSATIGTWDVSASLVNDEMFAAAQAFSQNINGWVLNGGTSTSNMFQGATASSCTVSMSSPPTITSC